MPKKKTTSGSKKTKSGARVRDLAPAKGRSAEIKGGLKKLPGKRTPPTVTLK